MVTVDARGLSCPEPVILTMNEAKNGTKEFDVLVDAEVCKDNVKRYAENNGFNVDIKKEGSREAEERLRYAARNAPTLS